MKKKHYGMTPVYTPLTVALLAHPFEGDPKDDYKCVHCGKPRALHADPEDSKTDNEPDNQSPI